MKQKASDSQIDGGRDKKKGYMCDVGVCRVVAEPSGADCTELGRKVHQKSCRKHGASQDLDSPDIAKKKNEEKHKEADQIERGKVKQTTKTKQMSMTPIGCWQWEISKKME